MYDQGRELLSHKFKSIIIEQEYGIKMKPTLSGNPQENATIKKIHQLVGNIVRTYNLQ